MDADRFDCTRDDSFRSMDARRGVMHGFSVFCKLIHGYKPFVKTELGNVGGVVSEVTSFLPNVAKWCNENTEGTAPPGVNQG